MVNLPKNHDYNMTIVFEKDHSSYNGALAMLNIIKPLVQPSFEMGSKLSTIVNKGVFLEVLVFRVL